MFKRILQYVYVCPWRIEPLLRQRRSINGCTWDNKVWVLLSRIAVLYAHVWAKKHRLRNAHANTWHPHQYFVSSLLCSCLVWYPFIHIPEKCDAKSCRVCEWRPPPAKNTGDACSASYAAASWPSWASDLSPGPVCVMMCMWWACKYLNEAYHPVVECMQDLKILQRNTAWLDHTYEYACIKYTCMDTWMHGCLYARMYYVCVVVVLPSLIWACSWSFRISKLQGGPGTNPIAGRIDSCILFDVFKRK